MTSCLVTYRTTGIFLLWIVLLGLFPQQYTVASQSSFPALESPISLSNYVEVLEDSSGLLDFEAVLTSKVGSRFQKLQASTFNAGITRSDFWFRIVIPPIFVDRLMDSGGSFYLEYDAPFLDFVTLYHLVDGRIVTETQTGDRLPFNTRPIASPSFVFPIDMSATGNHTLYIRAQNNGLMIGSFHLWSPDLFVEKNQRLAVVFGVFYGAMLIMALYNLLIFISLKDYSYLYYVIAIAFITLFEAINHGHASQYLWPAYPLLANLMAPVSIFCSIFFTLLFIRKFLNLQKEDSVWYLVFRSGEILSAALIPGSIVLDHLIAVNLGIFISILACIAILIVSIQSLRKGAASAQYFIVAWMVLVVCILVTALTRIFPFPMNAFFLNLISIGLIVEVLLLSLALADRFNRMQSAAKNALERGMRELKKSNLIQDQFLATISHELRTPMNGVEGAISLLEHGQLDDVDRVYLNTAKTSAEEMTRLIDSILRFTEMQAGSVMIKHESFNPVAFFSALSSDIEDRCITKGIHFKSHLPAAALMLEGDPDQLKLIVSQLCDNAIKYTPKGGRIELNVSMNVLEKGAALRVAVVDTGIGLEKEIQKHLFEPFRAHDAEDSASSGGLGIGLSLCRFLATKMGGTLSVTPNKDKGTTAELSLKLANANVALVSEEFVLEQSEKHVLIAEDNVVNQKVLTGILRKLGHQVTVVENGREAVDAVLNDGQFDLIFMDCQMPVMDGYDATIKIRNELHISLATLPIIAVTANAMSTDKDKCLRTGMNDYLAKPVKLSQIRQMLYRWCTTK